MSYWKTLNVSRETLEELEEYKESLLLWNRKINLISKQSAKNIWERHLLDSAQILKYLKASDRNILDMGSGGGLPGLVLGLVAKKKYPNLKVTLVESDRRKCVFLKEVVRAHKLNSVVLSERVELLPAQTSDVVTARAMAPLKTLLDYASPHLSDSGICVFLKGVNYKKEIDEALAFWRFNISVDASITNVGSVVLKITDLEQKNGA